MSENDSIAEIFVRLRSRLATAISGIVPPREIEDIVQDTYVRVSQAKDISRIKRPESFMYKTARNLALDHLKRAETRLTSSVIDVDELIPSGMDAQGVDQTLQTVVSDEEFAGFCDAVRYLPEQCRRSFVLRKVYGFTQKEIASAMSISESTVEKHIAQGVKRTMLYMKKTGNCRSRPAREPTHVSAGRGRGGL